MSVEDKVVHSCLIVDDDPRLLAAAQRELGQHHRVQTASNIREAMAVVQSVDVGVVFTDLRLGSESGLELIRRISGLPRPVKVILYSAYMTIECAFLAAKSGADSALSWPFSFRQQLERTVAGHSHRRVDDIVPTLKRVEWEYINRVINETSGNLSKSAKRLGLYRSSLQRRLKKLPPSR